MNGVQKLLKDSLMTSMYNMPHYAINALHWRKCKALLGRSHLQIMTFSSYFAITLSEKQIIFIINTYLLTFFFIKC